MLKLTYFLRKVQTSRVNNSKILTISNAKFPGYHFYMNSNIYRNFQIGTSVPLSAVVFQILHKNIIRDKNVTHNLKTSFWKSF